MSAGSERGPDDQLSGINEHNEDINVSDVVSVDLYGIKARVPVSLNDAPDQELPAAPVKSFAEIGTEVTGHLQTLLIKPLELLANLAELGAELPKQCTRVIRAIGSGSDAIAALLRRCAKGRARADHTQDQRIAECDASPPAELSDSAKSDRRDAALERLEELRSRFLAKNGYELPLIENDDGSILIPAVPPEQQSAAVSQMQTRLLEFSNQSGTKLETVDLPTRIVNALAKVGIHTTEELAKFSEAEIRRIDGIGKSSIRTLRPLLKR